MKQEDALNRALALVTAIASLASLALILVYLFKWQPGSCVLEPVGASLVRRAET